MEIDVNHMQGEKKRKTIENEKMFMWMEKVLFLGSLTHLLLVSFDKLFIFYDFKFVDINFIASSP